MVPRHMVLIALYKPSEVKWKKIVEDDDGDK
jgi:hypothetical protein